MEIGLWVPACIERCAGKVELVFPLIHCSPNLPYLTEGINRRILPEVFVVVLMELLPPSFLACFGGMILG